MWWCYKCDPDIYENTIVEIITVRPIKHSYSFVVLVLILFVDSFVLFGRWIPRKVLKQKGHTKISFISGCICTSMKFCSILELRFLIKTYFRRPKNNISKLNDHEYFKDDVIQFCVLQSAKTINKQEFSNHGHLKKIEYSNIILPISLQDCVCYSINKIIRTYHSCERMKGTLEFSAIWMHVECILIETNALLAFATISCNLLQISAKNVFIIKVSCYKLIWLKYLVSFRFADLIYKITT